MWFKLWCKYRQQRPYHQIEPKIKALVDYMNSMQTVCTVASCEGHGVLRKSPYVYFKASTHVAASMERILRSDAEKDVPFLHKHWSVLARFDGDFELCYFLYSPYYDRISTSVLESVWFFWLHRKQLDEDLKQLVTLLEGKEIN